MKAKIPENMFLSGGQGSGGLSRFWLCLLRKRKREDVIYTETPVTCRDNGTTDGAGQGNWENGKCVCEIMCLSGGGWGG